MLDFQVDDRYAKFKGENVDKNVSWVCDPRGQSESSYAMLREHQRISRYRGILQFGIVQ